MEVPITTDLINTDFDDLNPVLQDEDDHQRSVEQDTKEPIEEQVELEDEKYRNYSKKKAIHIQIPFYYQTKFQSLNRTILLCTVLLLPLRESNLTYQHL